MTLYAVSRMVPLKIDTPKRWLVYAHSCTDYGVESSTTSPCPLIPVIRSLCSNATASNQSRGSPQARAARRFLARPPNATSEALRTVAGCRFLKRVCSSPRISMIISSNSLHFGFVRVNQLTEPRFLR
jgi:hypothetical protein